MNKYVIDSTVFFKVQDEPGKYHTLIGCIVDYKYDKDKDIYLYDINCGDGDYNDVKEENIIG